jgi:hypothetical protein
MLPQQFAEFHVGLHIQSRQILRPFYGLDRTLSLLIANILVRAVLQGAPVTFEDICIVVGGYSSASTTRRCLYAFVQRDLATATKRGRMISYTATNKLCAVQTKMASIVGKSASHILRS